MGRPAPAAIGPAAARRPAEERPKARLDLLAIVAAQGLVGDRLDGLEEAALQGVGLGVGGGKVGVRGREGVGEGVFLRIVEFGLWRGANFLRKKGGGGVGCRE